MWGFFGRVVGGGWRMGGGPTSFGAGGWIDSDLAKALPVRLDPPQSRQMVRGALALIMHSCEMPQGNFWGQKVAQSAIEALSSLDYCGIEGPAFGFGHGVTFSAASWAFAIAPSARVVAFGVFCRLGAFTYSAKAAIRKTS